MSAELNEIRCKLISSGRKLLNGFLGQGRGNEGLQWAQGNFWGHRNVLDLDYGGGFMSIYI